MKCLCHWSDPCPRTIGGTNAAQVRQKRIREGFDSSWWVKLLLSMQKKFDKCSMGSDRTWANVLEKAESRR